MIKINKVTAKIIIAGSASKIRSAMTAPKITPRVKVKMKYKKVRTLFKQQQNMFFCECPRFVSGQHVCDISLLKFSLLSN